MPDDENPENQSPTGQEPQPSPNVPPERGSESAERTALSTQSSRELEDSRAELDQARAAIAQLEQERQSAEAAAQQRLAELETRNSELSGAALDAHRRAVLAENAGQVVPELVQGSTTEEIDASIEAAKAAYARIAESVRTAAQAELSRSPLPVVPPGNSPRGEPPAEELSPLQKITGALSRNGR